MGSRRCRLTLVVLIALAAEGRSCAPAVSAVTSDRAADTMRDLRDHFAACFHPPNDVAGSRVTFYFSIDTKGQIVAQPRTVLFGFKGAASDKAKYLSSLPVSLRHCLPLAMSERLAASIPGKIYFLQYAVDASGATSEVLFRPFGSHGGGGGGFVEPPTGYEPIEPASRSLPPARIPSVPPWAERPSFRRYEPPRQLFYGPRLPADRGR